MRFGGGLSLMLLHLMMRHPPSAARSRASRLHDFAATGSLALLCAPWSIAVCISCNVQLRPQSTGHPVVAYRRSSSAAGCTSAWLRGLIRPIYSGISITVSASVGDLLCDCVNGDGLWANAAGVGLAMTCASAGPAAYQDWFWSGNRVPFGGGCATIKI